MEINTKKLIQLRHEKDLTQQQVAYDTEMERVTLTRLESGKINNPELKTIVTLAEYYGVTINSLIIP